MRIRRLIIASAAGLGIFPAFHSLDALGATPPQSAAQQISSQAETFREEQKKKELVVPQKPDIVQKREKERPQKIEGPRFFVRKINLEGTAILPAEDLEKIIKPYEEKEASFDELAALADKITDLYIAAGHSTSQAYLPPQKVEDGVVTIKIIAGKVGAVQVEDNKYFKKEVYQAATRLGRDSLFTYQDLESSLFYLNQKPDLRARAYIVPGKEPETSDIILKAEDRFPIHAYYGFNNRGTKSTHRSRHEVHFDNNNLLGYGDVLNSSVSMAEEGAFEAGFVSYDFPVESTRTMLHLDASYANSSLIGPLKSAEISGKNLNVYPSLTQNITRSIPFSFDWFLGLDYTDSKTTVEDSKISFDRMRIFKTGPRLTFQDPEGRTTLSGDINQGIPDFLGGLDENDVKASRANSGGDSLFYTAGIARIQRLPDSMYLLVRSSGQWTRDTLTSVNEFRAGGAYSVRGYPESDALGDFGYNFSAEANSPIPFLPRDWEIPYSKRRAEEALRLALFLDGAKTFFREKSTETSVKDSLLLGAGVGLRVNLSSNTSMQLDFGWPFGDDSSENNRVQAHINLKVGF